MKIKKKLFAVVLAMVLAFSLLSAMAVSADQPISVEIDGQAVVFEAQGPVIVGGRTLVPVRGVFELLGFTAEWEAEYQRATLTSDSYVVVLTIGSYTFYTNEVSLTLDAPAQLIGGSTMLPLRAVLESVGHSVDWDPDTWTVLIFTGEPPQDVDPEPPYDYEDPEYPEDEYDEEENDEEENDEEENDEEENDEEEEEEAEAQAWAVINGETHQLRIHVFAGEDVVMADLGILADLVDVGVFVADVPVFTIEGEDEDEDETHCIAGVMGLAPGTVYPIEVDGSLYVPLLFVLEFFNVSYDFDAETQTWYIG